MARLPTAKGYIRGNVGAVLGLYRDNGKENVNYYLWFRVYGLRFRVLEGPRNPGTCPNPETPEVWSLKPEELSP